MITADRQDRASSGRTAPVVSDQLGSDPDLSAAQRFHWRIRILSDVACASLFLAVGIAAGFPLMWGLALQQTPMVVSAGCAEVMCVIVLLNRMFAPSAARERLMPFLAALEERPWVLVTCLALAGCSAWTLITYWPSASI